MTGYSNRDQFGVQPRLLYEANIGWSGRSVSRSMRSTVSSAVRWSTGGEVDAAVQPDAGEPGEGGCVYIVGRPKERAVGALASAISSSARFSSTRSAMGGTPRGARPGLRHGAAARHALSGVTGPRPVDCSSRLMNGRPSSTSTRPSSPWCWPSSPGNSRSDRGCRGPSLPARRYGIPGPGEHGLGRARHGLAVSPDRRGIRTLQRAEPGSGDVERSAGPPGRAPVRPASSADWAPRRAPPREPHSGRPHPAAPRH